MHCEHCIGGLMPVDSHDNDIATCLNCGRGTFRVDPAILAEEPGNRGIDPIRHYVYMAPRSKAASGLAEGRLVRW